MSQPEKFEGASANISDDQLVKLKSLFPEAITEGGKIDLDRLKLTLGESVDVGKERYGMNWAGKADCFKTIQRPSMATLVPARDESVNFDSTENLIIEGDNLETLKLLQRSYLGKVKMIYIDPPYNTSGDFIYPDDYSENLDTYLRYTGQIDDEGKKFSTNLDTDGRFHSKWLCMMYPRLYLARNLLKDEGVLVIHIDEHEQANLEFLLREIFGEENFLGTVVWDKRNPKGDATGVAYQHELILFCAKSKEAFVEKSGLERVKKNSTSMLNKARQLFSRIGKPAIPADLDDAGKKYALPPSSLEKHRRPITLEDVNCEFNDWIKTQEFSGGEAAYNKLDASGDVYRLVSMAWPNKKKAPDDYFIPLKHPTTGKDCPVPERGWRNPPQTMAELLRRGEIIFGPDETTQPQRKYLLKNNLTENFSSLFAFGASDDALLASMGIPFDNPKPVEVAKALISAITDDSDVVMDFFAGSGTTAHALLEQNKQDGKTRRFILVQLPEPTDRNNFETIAEITKERVRRVIKKLNDADNQPALSGEKKQDRGFKVFKLQSSNFKAWNSEKPKDDATLAKQLTLHVDHLVAGRTQEDVLYELLLKSGFPLDTKVEMITLVEKSVFSVADGAMLICLEKELTPEVIKAMAEKKPERVVCLDAGFADNDQLKTNAVQTMKSKGVLKFQTV
jgi:adenine-specific DNA-methyltransferase